MKLSTKLSDYSDEAIEAAAQSAENWPSDEPCQNLWETPKGFRWPAMALSQFGNDLTMSTATLEQTLENHAALKAINLALGPKLNKSLYTKIIDHGNGHKIAALLRSHKQNKK